MPALNSNWKKLKDRVNRAFSVAPEDPFVPTERQQEIVDKLGAWVVRRRLTVPAVMFLESVTPLNYLGSQVDFSTITVTVAEPQPTVEYDWGIDTAFKEGIRAFIGMIGALIVVTGYLIPLILYLAIGLAVLYIVARLAWNFYKSWKNKKTGKP